MICVGVLALAIWGAGLYLSHHYQDILKAKLKSRLPSGISLEFSHLTINLFKRSLTVQDVEIEYKPDSLDSKHFHSFKAKAISANGIGIMSYFTKDRLKIKDLLLQHPLIALDNELLKDSTKQDPKASQKKKNPKLDKVFIQTLTIEKLGFTLHADSLRLYSLLLNAEIKSIEFNTDSLTLQNIVYSPSHLEMLQFIHLPDSNEMYGYSFERLVYQQNRLQVDSFSLTPRHSKFDFGHITGKQIDRIDLKVTSIGFTDFNIKFMTDSTFKASSVTIDGANLYDFRDKRLPFIKEHDTPMPMDLLKDALWKIEIDTINVNKANIVYEEFPSKADESGLVSFENLNALILNVYSRKKKGFMKVYATTSFMKSGELRTICKFPYAPSELHSVHGSLSNFELTSMNPSLEHFAQIKIESGKMNEFLFDFAYDKDQSNGSVTLNYEGLKILSLKEKESQTVIDKFKTFLLNTFIIRKDKDEEVKKDKRTGEIHFQRDKRRSIFNYWWKSLADGIKSSYNLENLLKPKKEED